MQKKEVFKFTAKKIIHMIIIFFKIRYENSYLIIIYWRKNGAITLFRESTTNMWFIEEPQNDYNSFWSILTYKKEFTACQKNKRKSTMDKNIHKLGTEDTHLVPI